MQSSAVVATLIADPVRLRLSDAQIARLAQGVGGFNSQRWLDKGVAADLHFSAPLDAVRAALIEALAGEQVDLIVQSAAHRAKRLLVADLDSTLIGQEGVDELAAYAGVGDLVAKIIERAMRGEIAFEPALRERVRLLAGLSESVIADVLRGGALKSPSSRAAFASSRPRFATGSAPTKTAPICSRFRAAS